MPQIGVRLHDVAGESASEKMKTARALGFHCIQLAPGKVGLPGDPAALTPGYARVVGDMMREAGLGLSVLGCYRSPADESTHAAYEAYLRFAAYLGGCVVGTETNESPASPMDELCRQMEKIVRTAEKLGVVFAVEPVSRHVLSTPARAKALRDSMASPALQFIFDPVNLVDAAKASAGPDGQGGRKPDLIYLDELFAEYIEELGPDTAAIHLKDYYMEDGKQVFIPAGTSGGQLPTERIAAWIREKKPYIDVLLENTVPATALESRVYAERLLGIGAE